MIITGFLAKLITLTYCAVHEVLGPKVSGYAERTNEGLFARAQETDWI